MHVGWVGLGSMGAPMAFSVTQQRQHRMHGYARRPESHDALCEAGAIISNDLREVISTAQIVCVTLFSEAQIRELLLDGDALLAIPVGAALVIHTTVNPAFIRELAQRRPDIDVLDAGFSGSPDDARAGKLTMMVGGDALVLERVRPVLTAYAADPIAHVGPLGAGMLLKIINNLAFAANVAIARDALRLAREHGLTGSTVVETLMRGSAGSTALAILGRADPDASLAAIRPYLEKDVAIARSGAAGLALGSLGYATREFVV